MGFCASRRSTLAVTARKTVPKAGRSLTTAVGLRLFDGNGDGFGDERWVKTQAPAAH